MNTNLLLLIYGAVFIGALLFLEGLFYLIVDLRGGTTVLANRRLRLLASGMSREAALVKLRRQAPREARGMAAILPYIPGYNALDRILTTGGIRLSGEQAVLIFACLYMGFFLVLSIFVHLSTVTAALLALFLGIGAPAFVIVRIAAHRLKKLLAQLPDAIDMIVRSLRAGHPVSNSLSLVAEEAKDPIGTEFGITCDEMTYGLDFNDALLNLCDRVPVREVHFMAVAVRLQHSTGGDLAETLGVLSRVIRERGRMRDKIKALSGEGRMSAYVLSGLPFFIGGGLYLLNRNYYAGVGTDLVLTVAMAVPFLMMLFGIFMMFRIVNIRV